MEAAGVTTGAVMAVAVVVGSRRSSWMTYPGNAIRADSRRRPVRASGVLNAPSILRFGKSAHGLHATAHRRFPRAFSIIRARYSTDDLHNATHRHCPRASSFVNGPSILRFGYFANDLHAAAHRRCPGASEGMDNAPEDSTPPSFREKMLGMLRSDTFKLIMLGVSLLIGFMGAKDDMLAVKVVEVCDKTHKVYNIVSKALPVILAFLKGDT